MRGLVVTFAVADPVGRGSVADDIPEEHDEGAAVGPDAENGDVRAVNDGDSKDDKQPAHVHDGDDAKDDSGSDVVELLPAPDSAGAGGAAFAEAAVAVAPAADSRSDAALASALAQEDRLMADAPMIEERASPAALAVIKHFESVKGRVKKTSTRLGGYVVL